MTREQAIKHLEVIKGDCALVGDIRALDIAISALSADGEYIKKEDAINSTYFEPTYYDPLNVLTEARDKIKELRTYSFPDSENTGEWISTEDRPDGFCSNFEEKTNGEVLISLYPNLKYTIQNGRVVTTIGIASSFDLDWWNAPYQKGGE